MSESYFRHKDEMQPVYKLMTPEEGNFVVIEWYEDETKKNSTDYTKVEAERYLAKGTWIVAEPPEEPLVGCYFRHRSDESIIYHMVVPDEGITVHLDWIGSDLDGNPLNKVDIHTYEKCEVAGHFKKGYWIKVEAPKVETEQGEVSSHNYSVRIEGNPPMMAGFGLGPETTLGVARPILETRKLGKERIELFDDGFPNAIREIVKVMTWAQEVKEYKDHDWKNLPNPENTLSGAGSRHRNDHNIQKAEGVPALERIDHESKKVHLAHQAFNVLAELELVLTGKIK